MAPLSFDYTSLLRRTAQETEKKKQEKEARKAARLKKKAAWAANPVAAVVPDEKRRRSSLMDNPKMHYVLDTSTDLFHDRDCTIVDSIKDENFSMVEDLTPEEWKRHGCRYCYQKSLVRKGIGDQGKYINAYLKIFQALKANTYCLEKLFLEHNATLISAFPSQCALCIQVGEDRWIIQGSDSVARLWHNNYRVLPSGERVFLDQYHAQTDEEKLIGSFRHFTFIMCGHVGLEYDQPITASDVRVFVKERLREGDIALPLMAGTEFAALSSVKKSPAQTSSRYMPRNKPTAQEPIPEPAPMHEAVPDPVPIVTPETTVTTTTEKVVIPEKKAPQEKPAKKKLMANEDRLDRYIKMYFGI